jgi:hypothetical protein
MAWSPLAAIWRPQIMPPVTQRTAARKKTKAMSRMNVALSMIAG